MLPWRISPNLTILMTLYLLNLLLITNGRQILSENLLGKLYRTQMMMKLTPKAKLPLSQVPI